MLAGALDLGSNSFHVQVAEVDGDGIAQVARAKRMLRLGSVLAEKGQLGEEAVARATDAAGELVDFARQQGCQHVVAAATAAVRRAPDGAVLVQRVEERTGVAVTVLTGEEEAALTFEAARVRMAVDHRPVLVVDVGGGSLELMVGTGAGLSWSCSLPLGVGTVTAGLVRADPPTGDDRRRLDESVRHHLAPHAESIARLGPVRAVGTSGTLLTLLGLAAGDGSPPAGEVGVGRLRELAGRLFALDHAGRMALPGVEERRADLLPAGIAIALGVLGSTGLPGITPCDWALREGMLLAAARKAGRPAAEGCPGSEALAL